MQLFSFRALYNLLRTNLYHLLEFGSKKTEFTNNFIIFHKWVRVEMGYMLVIGMKMVLIGISHCI